MRCNSPSSLLFRVKKAATFSKQTYFTFFEIASSQWTLPPSVGQSQASWVLLVYLTSAWKDFLLKDVKGTITKNKLLKPIEGKYVRLVIGGGIGLYWQHLPRQIMTMMMMIVMMVMVMMMMVTMVGVCTDSTSHARSSTSIQLLGLNTFNWSSP